MGIYVKAKTRSSDLTELLKFSFLQGIQYFNRKSMELKINLPVTVKDVHNLDLRGVLRIETGESREIG
jgi:hypothetical protein